LTVVTTPALSRQAALTAIAEDGKKLAAHIERRFPKAIYILVPEVDILLAKNVSASLFADARWKKGLGRHQIIYKVHFHNIICVPSMTTAEVQSAFYVTPTGKRSKNYAGANQVRALEISNEESDTTKGSDIYNCFGYATKGHFRPPVMDAMSECFAEWLLLTDEISSNQKLIVTGGSVRGIFKYCSECNFYYRPDDSCKCKSTITIDDDICVSSSDIENNFNSHGHTNNTFINTNITSSELCSKDSPISLNCSSATSGYQKENPATKKENGLIATIASAGRRMWQMINPVRAP
jgi:hypothetical protein